MLVPAGNDWLRQERERIGLTQQEMADGCGVTMRSQRNYEMGERFPDARYLAAAAALGIDVLYVLTGQRTGGAAAPTRGPIDVAKLLEVYELIEWVARKTGKRWSERKKIELAVKGYNILVDEPAGAGTTRYAKVLGVVEGA